MPLHPKTLKASAREAMRAAAPPAFLVTLIYLLLTQVLTEVVYAVMPSATIDDLFYGQGGGTLTALFLTVLLIIYQAVMTFGYSCWALRTARGEAAGLGALMEGFGMVGRVLLMEITITLSILGWTLLLAMGYALLVVPAMLVFSYSAGLVVLVLLTLAFYAAVFAVGLRYDLAHFLLCDYPDAGAGKAVRRCLDMIHGRLWPLMKLYLSFWPWYLLTLLLGVAVVVIALLPVLGECIGFYQTGSLDAMSILITTAMSGALATAASTLLSIPLKLFFQPYQRIAVANFYRALSLEGAAQAPFGSQESQF